MHVSRWTYRQTGYTTEIIANVTSEILIIFFKCTQQSLEIRTNHLPGKYSDKFLEILLRTTF